MNDIKQILSNFNESDYQKDVNLHIHTVFSDGKATPEEILNQAKELGLKKIAICDHNTVNAYLVNDTLKDDMVITGVEFDCWFMGCLVHILGYGIDVNNSDLQAICAKTKAETEADIVRLFMFRNPKKAIDAIHKAGGIAVLAHPACCWVLNLKYMVKKLIELGLDGMEVYYQYRRHRSIIKFHSEKAVAETAELFNLIKTGGTDEHGDLK